MRENTPKIKNKTTPVTKILTFFLFSTRTAFMTAVNIDRGSGIGTLRNLRKVCSTDYERIST